MSVEEHPHEHAHAAEHLTSQVQGISENHDHDHDHEHEQGGGAWGWLKEQLLPHSHSHYEAALDARLGTDRGIWALKISLVGLLATALLQVFVVLLTRSVALQADTIHNFSDALTALPLWLAFSLARRAGNRRYTYGYGRAEDLAGVLVVLAILASAGQVIWQSVDKILQPQAVSNLGWLAAAAVIGFLGNELVALFRIRVGREIGSAALVADGLHARSDGLTSLGVLAGAIGVWLGFPLADPLVGLLIGVVILLVGLRSAREMGYRLMDAVDPELTQAIERLAAAAPGVMDVHSVTLRWTGHRLRGELHTVVDCQQSTRASHAIAEDVRHRIFHAYPALVEMTVHVDPCECEAGVEYHPTSHHRVQDGRGGDVR